ncbi:MAG: SpoIIE family protein phosphatase [Peptostreptococcus sp.]|uniref:GAF domain-containing SpoIIE family protein phosphatase n=1 Tax=Peptostreptococcus sp. TaxID=1262 RepID=UPI002FCBB3B8
MSDVKRMKNLVEISKIVTSSDNFFEIKDLIINKMLNVVHPTKACVNLFYDKDYSYSHLVCSATLDYIPKLFPKNEEYGAKIDFNLYPEYIHEAVFQQKVVVIPDVLNDKRADGEQQMAIQENYTGRAVFPFVINKETVGFMTCYLQKDEEITQRDIDFITQVASLMSLSISTTNKNRDIQGLINKLRTSISNINKAARKLYSSKDIFYYLNKMASVIADTTNSKYAVINVYNTGDKGEILGQKISTAFPQDKMNQLNSIMPQIIKSNKFSGLNNSIKMKLPDGTIVENYLFYKFVIDSNSELVVVCAGSDNYSADDENTISILSKQVRSSIQVYEYYQNEEKHKDIENDLSILKRQQGLIMNSNSDLEVFSDNQMYFYHETAKLVGGDFYNAIDLGDKIIFIVADVMGHGVVSNYIVAIIKGAFDILARYTTSPKEILRQMNDYLYNEFDKMGIYSTAIVGVFDKKRLKLTLANAGHYFPTIVYNDYTIVSEQEGERGIPIGIMQGSPYTDVSYDLSNVRELCFFTDGILEMKNEEGVEFGLEGLNQFLIENIDSDKKTTLENMKSCIDNFVYNQEKLDDILVVFIKDKELKDK